MDRAGGVPDIAETKNYVLNILSRAAGFDSPELQSFANLNPAGTLAADLIPEAAISAPALVALNNNPLSGAGGCQTAAADR